MTINVSHDMARTIDRRKGAPEGIASQLNAFSPGGQVASAKAADPVGGAAEWRPGESFSRLLNRQVSKSKPAVEDGSRAGEGARDYLNRVVAKGSRGLSEDGKAGVEEAPRDLLNRRGLVGPPAALKEPVATTMPAESKPAVSASGALNHQKTVEAADGATERQKRAEKAAGDLVSNALILPMLKQLRRSPWGENGLFSGGIGEKTFGPEFDMQIADRIAHSPRLGVKAAIASRLMKRENPDAAKTTQTAKVDVHG